MKKRLLVKLLCAAMCTSMIAEVGAAAFTDDISVVQDASMFTDTASDVVVEEEIPEVEEPVIEESMEEEIPVIEDVPVFEDVPVVDETPEEDVPSEDTVVEEENQETTDLSEVEEVPTDIFTSEITESEDFFISVEVDTTDLVNQDGIAYFVTDWKSDDEGWKLMKEDDTYFDLSDGIVRVITKENETTPCADGYYLFDADGYLVTGRYMMQPGIPGYIYDVKSDHFYMDDANATLNSGIASGTAKTPYNSNLGQLQRNYWLWTGTAYRFYDKNGKFTNVETLRKQQLANQTYTGYHQIDGYSYALKDNGVPRTGSVEIKEGNKQGYYWFYAGKNDKGIPGWMIKNKWVSSESNTRWRYYGSDGRRTNFASMITDLAGRKGNYTYLLDSAGYIVKNAPRKVDGVYYYGDKNGRIVKDKLITYNGKRYYFTSNGKRATYQNQWKRLPGAKNKYYYFGSTAGRVSEKTGWQRINGDWYYFTKKGNHYVSAWTNLGRYYQADGSLASGIVTVDGKKYYFEPSTSSTAKGIAYKNKLFKYDGNYYYAKADRSLLKTGWVKLDGYYYYFKNYVRQEESFAKLNGVNGYLDSKGRYTTGWIIYNDAQNLVRYVNPTGNDFYRNTTAWIDGLQYRFDGNGFRVNDRTDELSGPYYVEADIVNCVMTIYNSSKTIPIKSIRISPGAAGTETPTGTFHLNRLGRWWTLMGPSYGQYCSHVVGAGAGGIIVHSVPSDSPSIWSFSPSAYKLLGKPASHGCIRVCVADAKWVYDNCQGATIRIFRGDYTWKEPFRGPLGRRPLIPATGNYDPTDPAIVGNKYYYKY